MVMTQHSASEAQLIADCIVVSIIIAPRIIVEVERIDERLVLGQIAGRSGSARIVGDGGEFRLHVVSHSCNTGHRWAAFHLCRRNPYTHAH